MNTSLKGNQVVTDQILEWWKSDQEIPKQLDLNL